jgi:hypothetical protein
MRPTPPPLWELQRLQEKYSTLLGIVTDARELHVVVKIPYVYNYLPKLRRTQA